MVFLAVGGLMGLLVALTRWPAVHLLPAEWFYLVLTGHGANVLLFWIIFFEIAVLYFASAILLNCRLAAPKLAWLGVRIDGRGRGARQCHGAAGRFERDVHLLSADAGEAEFLSRLILFAVGALIGVCSSSRRWSSPRKRAPTRARSRW